MTITFRYKKSTKNKLMFQEIDEQGREVPEAEDKVGSLYVRKTAFGGPAMWPDVLKVTIEVVS
jgi:hypothetical protein